MQMTAVTASGVRKDIYRVAGTSPAREAGDADLNTVSKGNIRFCKHIQTCKYGRLQQLNQFINLDQHVDRHFQLGAFHISHVY